MKNINYFNILFFCLFIIINDTAHSSDQKCIISNGVPNHEIGKFPTKGNPNKFQKQKLRFCFSNSIPIVIELPFSTMSDLPILFGEKRLS